MYYFFAAVIVFIIIGLIYRLILPGNEPDFELMGIQSDDSLKLTVIDLASKSKKCKMHGKGLSLKTICRNSKLAFKIIKRKVDLRQECHEFEKWIYDNYYKINEAIERQKKQLLGYHQLPHINELPRIYYYLKTVVKASGGSYTKSLIKDLTSVYCSITPLSFSEINSFKSILEYCLLEYITIFCAKAVVINKKFSQAVKDAKLDSINLSFLNFNSYVLGLSEFSSCKLKRGLSEICLSNGISLKQRIENFYRQISVYNGNMQAAVTNIHKLVNFDDEFIISLSPLYKLFLLDAQSNFSDCTLATQYVYLFNIAKIARKRRLSELAFARIILEKSSTTGKDIAEFILPINRSKLLMRLYAYLTLAICIAIDVLAVYFLFPRFFLIGFVIFPIVFGFVTVVSSEFLGIFIKRRYLPRKNLQKTDYSDCKTMILFSRLVANIGEIEDVFTHLETIRYANGEDVFSYGALIDLPSSNRAEFNESEREMVAKCQELYQNLREKERFNIFIRSRSLIKGGTKYQGWEKKRGALLDLNTLILNGDTAKFDTIIGNSYDVKYIVALDSDTLLNSGLELVEIMEHPYNKEHSVASITMTSNPISANKTLFSRLMSGTVGLNSYSLAGSEFSFDVFGHGNFTGKGIYRVKEFHGKVSDKFMDNRILSHDFIEGAIAGCVNTTDSALDNFPSDFSSYITRQLRWLRGDWQLLPYLFFKIRDKKEKRIINPLAPIDKWHILCNLINSLISVSTFTLIILSLFVSPRIPILLFAFALSILFVINSLRSIALRNAKNSLFEFVRQLYNFSCLPVIAIFTLYSILITLLRLLRKRKLLEWKVFAHSNNRVSFVPNIISALLILTISIIYQLNIVFIFIATIFILAPVIDIILSREFKISRKRVTTESLELLNSIAKSTWEFFKKQLDDKRLLLPVDNYQEYLGIGYVMRTSPTNIGMTLVSVCAALEMGFIDLQYVNTYIEKIVDSIEKAEKWYGNLYNWIDTSSLKALNPRYVSAVDSGNLLAGLLLSSSYVTHNKLKGRIEKLIDETDLSKLFDFKRGLFYIGYNDTIKSFDKNHYDLMASEAILTYLVGIGTGKIKKQAWKNLSRQHVKYAGKLLFSWTGGLFEYLMPSLFFEYPKRCMLHLSAKNAVKSNIKYAKKIKSSFWGISESQYLTTDDNGLYRYKAFGVPNIALSNQEDKNVFAPYASILSLKFSDRKTIKNIEYLSKLGLYGEFGFYEAIDSGDIVKTYMSHHQGMILCSIANYLKDNVMLGKMKENASVRAAELLMSQPMDVFKAKKKIRSLKPFKNAVDECELINKQYALPRVNLLSGGRFNLLIDSYGKGYSIFDDIYISRADSFSGMKLILKTHGESINILGGVNTTNNFFSSTFSISTEKIASTVTAIALPNIGGEAREVIIKNLCGENIEISLSSFIEVSLSKKDDYIAHRAYSNMFLFSKKDTENDFIFVRRNNKNYPILAHFFSVSGVDYSGSRAKLLKRGKAGNDFGYCLDTALSGTYKKILEPLEELRLRIYSLVSYDFEYIKRQVKIVRSEGYFKRALGECFSLSKTLNPNQKTKLIASRLLFSNITIKTGLVKIGINAEIPLIVFELADITLLQSLKAEIIELLKLSRFDIHFNLVILYNEQEGYLSHTKEALNTMLDEISIYKLNNSKIKFILIDKSEASRELIEDLDESKTEIDCIEDFEIAYSFTNNKAQFATAELPEIKPVFKLGIGGFLENGAYFMDLTNIDTPSPWSNIIANNSFGTLITESGGGYTYSNNSRENKLTSWSNDNIADYPSESIVLQERDVVWSITKRPLKTDSEYYVIHSFGYSEFINNYNGLLCHERQYICGKTKYFDIIAINRENCGRIISFAAIIEAVLGTHLSKTSQHLSFTIEDNAIIVKNNLSGDKLLIQSNFRLSEYAFFKECFIDAEGKINRAKDFGKAGHSKCAAYGIKVAFKPFESIRVIFSLGIDEKINFLECDSYLEQAKSYYGDISSLSIKTDNKELDFLLKWLPNQTLSSRFYARTGFYQAGGAKGFRDQLQDCLALLYINPTLVRAHILDAAAHQFESGDVQHWWHEPAVGVRTHISDDKLFLPYVTAEYIQFTGDYEILNERVPYLKNIIIPKNQPSVYASAEFLDKSESINKHCIKAIESALSFGENGLMLMGGGDWNDAMDLIGEKGKGTTVWGSMFLYYVIKRFMPFVTDSAIKKRFFEVQNTLRQSVEQSWDGEWFLRAYTDDGRTVGSAKDKECKIDLISQSWAQISGIADKEKAEIALQSAAKQLIDTQNGIIRLLWPPFIDTDGIGYISNYPPGVRENGGQYTHGAVWFIISLFDAGKIELAYELLNMINPINKCKTIQSTEGYSVEPYVMAADVYAGEHAGKGGWTWYTGAAAWMYKCVVESLLGIKINKDILTIEPNLPKSLKNVSIIYKTRFGNIEIFIQNESGNGNWYAQIGKIKYNSTRLLISESLVGKKIFIKKSLDKVE